jgi:flavin reductase (DIM6/NTAB) family NADH-FMN oxidoreductase RutF
MFFRCDASDGGLPRDPFKACVVPRPIGWISTLDAQGLRNLAPFSFFNAISERPPMVMFCANGRHVDGGEKDSVRNARQTGEFVVNLATWDLREAVNASSAEVAHTVDEFELAKLTPAACVMVRPPRVRESPISLECVVSHIHELPGNAPDQFGRMVMGRVVGIHIDDSVIEDGRVSIGRLAPIARLGYRQYARLGEIFEMSRPGTPS